MQGGLFEISAFRTKISYVKFPEPNKHCQTFTVSPDNIFWLTVSRHTTHGPQTYFGETPAQRFI